MALHDLWHFENAPVGLNLCTAALGATYNGATIYNQYTGNAGQPLYSNGATNTWSVSADGFLVSVPVAGGTAGGLFVPTASVQDWSVATQYWFGFRTKIVSGAAGGAANLCGVTNSTSQTSMIALLTETQLSAAGYSVAGVEHYVEVFLDRSALTFQVYVDGLLINSGALTTAAFLSTGLIWFGSTSTYTGTMQRGFRDFYFLDVDATTPGRLGPIRSKASTTGAASGSEWTPNGAADLVTALNTANVNPPVSTPSVQSPADNQQLVLTMATGVSDTNQRILAVQPTLSFVGANGNVAKVKGMIQDKTLNTQVLGSLTTSAGLALNQKYPFQTKAPDGTNWTAAKINQTNFVLIPNS